MDDRAAGKRGVVYQLRRTAASPLEGILIIKQYVRLHVRKLTCAALDAARAAAGALRAGVQRRIMLRAVGSGTPPRRAVRGAGLATATAAPATRASHACDPLPSDIHRGHRPCAARCGTG